MKTQKTAKQFSCSQCGKKITYSHFGWSPDGRVWCGDCSEKRFSGKCK